ncbi:hypothetical protein UY3_15483 [Chelonia mydas]|uniref:Uncharacterized protein n=1 Tax=Chelonia mydas TaxID=8469 RepID=M7B5K1_CHEMY|nr:hypothetical protein UY3_15483 [Chelonia mydas]
MVNYGYKLACMDEARECSSKNLQELSFWISDAGVGKAHPAQAPPEWGMAGTPLTYGTSTPTGRAALEDAQVKPFDVKSCSSGHSHSSIPGNDDAL